MSLLLFDDGQDICCRRVRSGVGALDAREGVLRRKKRGGEDGTTVLERLDCGALDYATLGLERRSALCWRMRAMSLSSGESGAGDAAMLLVE